MSIIYMQGFDLHRSPTTYATGDLGNYFGIPALNNTFVTGYAPSGTPGQALFIDSPLYGRERLYTGTGKYIWGFWAQGTTTNIGGQLPWFQLKIFDTLGNINWLGVSVDDQGAFQIWEALNVGTPWPAKVTKSGTATGLDTSWSYYELSFDITGGVVTIKRDGVTLLTSAGVTIGTVDYSYPQFQIYGESSTWDYNVDHLWCSDTPLVSGSTTLAVQTDIAQDRYDASLNGFQATLWFGSSEYKTPNLYAGISSQNYGGSNYCNVMEHRWPLDPRDNSAWDDTKFSEITGYGLCHTAPGSATAEERVDGLVLSRLIYNNGAPLVLSPKITTLTSLSGTWRKGDSNTTTVGALSPLPRDNITLEVNAKSLYAKGVGCIVFSPVTDLTPTDTLLGTAGITFAEEFRTDYLDWVRVLSTGVPFESSFTAGYGIFGEGNREFQNNYLTVNYKNVPTGGAYIQGLWDYTTDPATGRWSMKQSVYRGKANRAHDQRKLKIRGHGKALQLRVTNYNQKPFEINGWSLFVTSNTKV